MKTMEHVWFSFSNAYLQTMREGLEYSYHKWGKQVSELKSHNAVDLRFGPSSELMLSMSTLHYPQDKIFLLDLLRCFVRLRPWADLFLFVQMKISLLCFLFRLNLKMIHAAWCYSQRQRPSPQMVRTENACYATVPNLRGWLPLAEAAPDWPECLMPPEAVRAAQAFASPF